MSENIKNKTKEDNVNTSNIFDDFEVDDSEVVDDMVKKKEFADYLKIIGTFFKYINFFLLVVIVISFFYIYIQKNDGDIVKNKDYLNPICNLLNGGQEVIGGENCSSITVLNNIADKNKENLIKQEFELITKTLKNNFELYNVFNSREILFVLDKTKNKNDQYKILDEFDLLKSEFTKDNPSKIQCKDLKINGDIFSIKCSAYSRGIWESDIPGFNGELSVNQVHGTTRTLASSFINYIEKSGKFNIIKKQKTFSIEPYFGEYSYSYKTDFELNLKFLKNNNLIY